MSEFFQKIADFNPWLLWPGVGLLGLVGMWLMYRGFWGDRARGRLRCPKCWYDMRGSPSRMCPECGYQAEDDKELGRTRRRYRRGLSGLIIGLILPGIVLTINFIEHEWYYSFLPKWKFSDEKVYAGYTVTRYVKRDQRFAPPHRKIVISVDGEIIYSMTGMYLSIGSENDKGNMIGVGDDITGDDIPNLIFHVGNSGNECFPKFYLYSLDDPTVGEIEDFQPVALVDQCGYFEDLDEDGIAEFVAFDRTYKYRWTCGACSPMPRVVLRFNQRGRRFVVDPIYLMTVRPTEAEFSKMIRQTNKEQDWLRKKEIIVKDVIKLIYGSHADLAWRYIDATWTDDEFDAESFKSSVRNALKQSPFHMEVMALQHSESW